MMNFKPNVRLERNIVNTLLNEPELIESVEIDPKWFNVPNLSCILQAIQADCHASDYVTWYTLAKQYGYQDTFSNMQKLIEGFVTDSQFKYQVLSLKKEYLNNMFNNAIKECFNNPSEKNQQYAVDILNRKRSMASKDDSGDIKQTGNDLMEAFNHDQDKGIQPKFFDKFCSLNNGGIMSPRLMIGGARPGVGKTAFATNLAKGILLNHDDVEVDFFTLEQDKSEIYNRLVASLTGIDHKALSFPHERLNDPTIKEYVRKAVTFLNNSNLKIYDNDNRLQDILNKMKQNAAGLKKNHYIAIVDYIGLINAGDDLPRYLQLGHVTRDLKQFARRYEAPIIGLSQIKRDIDERESNLPKLSDLRESGSIEQDADCVFFLSKDQDATENMNSNDESAKILNINFEKNRSGILGKYHVLFNGAKMKMKEIDQ